MFCGDAGLTRRQRWRSVDVTSSTRVAPICHNVELMFVVVRQVDTLHRATHLTGGYEELSGGDLYTPHRLDVSGSCCSNRVVAVVV